MAIETHSGWMVNVFHSSEFPKEFEKEGWYVELGGGFFNPYGPFETKQEAINDMVGYLNEK